jgi:hypothetical protein
MHLKPILTHPKSALSAVLLMTLLIVVACGGAEPAAPAQEQAPAAEAMAEKEDMADEAMAKDEAMTEKEDMADETMQNGEAMAEKKEMPADAMKDDKAMAEKEEMAGEAMADEAAMELPAWFEAELTNVNTGQTFKVADFQGKVVLVETMAVWCTNCLAQQREVQVLPDLLGDQPNLVRVALDIDPNETADKLKAFTDNNGFDWLYAVAPAEVAHDISQLYGGQFLNPPATPMLIIDRHGQAHPLPFGHKSAQSLQEALAPFLNEG